MRGLCTTTIIALLLVATVESHSLKRDIKVPDVRSAVKAYFEGKKYHAISRNKRQNSECEAAHLEASSPKYGECAQIYYYAIGFQEISAADIETYCTTDDCQDYLYRIDEELIDKCPDDPGVSRPNFTHN